MIKINICAKFIPELFPNNLFLIWYWSIDKRIHLPINTWHAIQEICTMWYMATLISFCVNKHWFKLFVLSDAHYKCTYTGKEESSVQNLHWLSSLWLITETALKWMTISQSPNKKAPSAPSPGSIPGLEAHCSVPTRDPATPRLPYPFLLLLWLVDWCLLPTSFTQPFINICF